MRFLVIPSELDPEEPPSSPALPPPEFFFFFGPLDDRRVTAEPLEDMAFFQSWALEIFKCV